MRKEKKKEKTKIRNFISSVISIIKYVKHRKHNEKMDFFYDSQLSLHIRWALTTIEILFMCDSIQMIRDRSQFICTGNFCVTDETNMKLLRLVADQSVGSCENFQLSVWSQLSSLLKFICSKSCHVFIQTITTFVYKRTLSIICSSFQNPVAHHTVLDQTKKNWNGSKTGICKKVWQINCQ